MGYRSDVGLALSARGKAALDAALAEAEKSNEHYAIIKELLEHGEKRTDEETGAAAWLWEGLKWYSDYVDVSFIENFLCELEPEDYLFIRVGEADDDTEYTGGFWENPMGMSLLRGIAFDQAG